MLLVILAIALVLEFETYRGEILDLFAIIEKGQFLRAPSVGRHNSTRVDEGRKGRSLLATKMKDRNRSGQWGGGRRACYA